MIRVDWSEIQAFVSVAQLGTLTQASTELGVSISTLSRRLDALERQMGVSLFRRGPKGASLTPEGTLLLKQAKKGANHFQQLNRLAKIFREGPDEVPIRLSATESMMSDVLAPRLAQLIKSNPDLKLELDVSNNISDINAGEADIAIRMVRPASESLVARRLPKVQLGLFCSDSYLGKRASSELDLKNERLIWLDKSFGDIAENLWLMESGLETSVTIRAVSVRSMLMAAISGAGIALLPRYSALAHNLNELPGFTLPARSPWLTFHDDSRHHPRMKAVREWIVQSCKNAFQ